MLMMTFPILKVYRGCCFDAVRAAALYPLTGCPEPTRSPGELAESYDSRDGKLYDKLRKMWHGQLHQFAGAGWFNRKSDGTVDLLQLTYASNCPPFGVRCDTKARSCHRVRLCPFCYARDILYPAARAVELVSKILTMEKKAEEFVFLGMLTKRDFSFADRTPAEWVSEASKSVWWLYNKLKATGPVYGAISDVVLSPGRAEGSLFFRRGTIAIVRKDKKVTGLSANTKTVPASDTSEAVKLVGSCFQYPVGQMRGDPAVTVALLQAMAAVKAVLSVSVGVLQTNAFQGMLRDYLKT